jgi:hypothetical protein
LLNNTPLADEKFALELSTVIEVSLLFPNACSPIAVTLAGMVMEERFGRPSNAYP